MNDMGKKIPPKITTALNAKNEFESRDGSF